MKAEFLGKGVMITGATGFVGGHLARKCLALGAKVNLLVRRAEESKLCMEFRAAGANIIQGDLREPERVMAATHGMEYVFHIGAIFREAKFADSVYFDINLGGTTNVLEAARVAGVRRIVFCSTNGVHGGKSAEPVDEKAPFCPTDVYQQSKLEAENAVMAAYRAGDVDVSIIRPAMIWGEGDLRFMKLFRGIAKRRLPIIGSGKTWCHFIWVEDLVNAFLLAAMTPGASGQSYLIAGRRPVYLEFVYETIAQLASVKVVPFRVPVWPFQLAGDVVELLCKPLGVEPPIHRRRADFFIKHRNFNTAKAQRELGFIAARDFEAECEQLYNWYKERGYLM